jgi:hypothetical protein
MDAPPAFVAPPDVAAPVAPPEPPPLAAPSPFGLARAATAELPAMPTARAQTSELPRLVDAPSSDLGQTVAAVSPFALGASLPFRAGATKPPSTPPGGPSGGLPFRATADSDAPPAGLPFRATADSDAPPAGLPFRAAAPEAEPPAPALPFRGAAPPPAAGAAAARRPRAKTEQLSLDDAAAQRGEPLPFKRSDSSPPLRATSPRPGASSAGLPFQSSAPPARASEPEAVVTASAPKSPTTPAPAGSAPMSPTTPAPAGPAPVARLPLARFAQMTAESQLWPTALAAIRARYGLDDAAYSSENEAWQRLFLGDAALYARYGQLLSHYRDWLAKSAR